MIATPGRLIDHILKTPGFSLESLRYLVIDEADRATEWLQYIPEAHSGAPPLTLENLSSRYYHTILLTIYLSIYLTIYINPYNI